MEAGMQEALKDITAAAIELVHVATSLGVVVTIGHSVAPLDAGTSVFDIAARPARGFY